ncbi:23S rRNA (guanosine(2251)-2'-O)-methyltransferase RlmB [Marinicrinis sediminis]|uniref:23S rRNA (Guanosine(2251)-2'-O)-methyltransferase RlmB n=1 Tax=Marinicrinis sediminis TaxID=1652465 RepID=A0ABW5RBR0_9BACL
MSEYLGGKHAVMEALKAGREIHKIWMASHLQPHQAQPILQAAKEAGIIVSKVDRKKLDQLAEGVQHQGVIAQVAAASYVEVEDILERAAQSGRPPFILLLNELEDPHNLGSILRSAECAGVHGIIIPKRRSVGLTATVAKTSVGAVEYVPVARVSNLAQTMEQLKEAGIWIVGADGTAEQELYEVDMKMPLAIVIGNEHKGMNRLIREKCDFLAKLPMFGQINSLNASVAAGLFMYEVVRQRTGRG